jgi:hypothetical protein
LNGPRLRLILLSLTWLGVGLVVAAQDPMTVVATKQPSPPPRGRGPFPGSMHPGHSAGLPIRLDLLILTTALQPDETVLVDFVITNVGTEAISLPSSVNQNIEKQTSVLTLWLTSDAIKDEYFRDTASGRLVKIEMVRTSAELYGSSDDPRTFIVLAPNKSMRVHASSRIRLQPGSGTLTAHAELIHFIARNSSSSSEVVGTADSEAVITTISAKDPAPR